MECTTFRVMGGLSAEELCRVALEESATVHDLKRQLEQILAIPTQEQQLLLGRRVMRDSTHLEDLLTTGSSELVEVSLVRTNPLVDPRMRQRSFVDNYLSHPMRCPDSRYEFHHTMAHTQTDLDRGFSSSRRLYIRLQQDSKHTATFNLCSLDFPLCELFDTFSEQLGVPVSELHFSFQGKHLGRQDTPHLCCMEACSLEDPHVIEVQRVGGQRQRQQLLAILNKMGDAVKLTPSSAATVQVSPLCADMLVRSMMYLGVDDLLNTTVVNTFWFHATQRLSLMLQLRHGDVSFISAPPEEYTAWLTRVLGHTQQLALAEARERHNEVKVWQGLNVYKEKTKERNAYQFTKAAGCTDMKTVSLAGLSAEFEHQWLSLHSCKVKFMADCKARYATESGSVANPSSAQQSANDTSIPVKVQDIPTAEGENFTAEAVSPEFRAVAVELFRRYFSPDMYFIFPLIVNQEAAFGLDFRTTTTTLFFGPQSVESIEGTCQRNPSAVAPAGACSWRLRCSLLPEPQPHSVLELEQPLPLLEVLFIAVWEEERHQVHGGTLVADLEVQARAAGAKMMYVEIGFEQPKARRFWRKQGFGKVARLEMSEDEKQHVCDAEQEDDVPVPVVFLPDSQLAFFESNCLRFSDTAQYVKLLQ